MKEHAVAIVLAVITALVVSGVTAFFMSYGQGSEAIDELRIRAIAEEEIAEHDVDDLDQSVDDLTGAVRELSVEIRALRRDTDRIDRFIEDL